MFDPADVLGVEGDAVALYSRAENYLIRLIRDTIIRVGESPDWAEAQLLAIRQERGNIEGLAQALQDRAPELWRQSIDAAYVRGVIAAEVELADLPPAAFTGTFVSANPNAVYALAAEGVGVMSVVHQNLLRSTEDVWRRIVTEAIGYSTTGSMTTFQAAQRAYTRMAREGLGFFTDKAGRRWGLDTYAEMATRTGTTRALRAGHTNTMLEAGVDLVVISSHPNPAPQCAPYERKVVSLSGATPSGVQRIGDHIVSVVGTMAEAEANGLHHVNCRHTHSAFVPGFTDLTRPAPDPNDEGYRATQKQRYYERQIRASRRMEEAAIDPADVANAKARARAYQAKLRDHIQANGLPRRRHRERIRRTSTTLGADF